MEDFKRSLLSELYPSLDFSSHNSATIDGEFEAAISELLWEKESALEFRAVIDHVLKWNGLELGIEYLPGQVRFSGTKKLRSGYGHIRGFRDDTGEAPDVYVAPDVFEGKGSDRLFCIAQIAPEDGDFDEYKWMVGYANLEAAKQAYLTEMPSQYFGSIAIASIASLNRYRKNLNFAEGQELQEVLDGYAEQAALKAQGIIEEWKSAIAAKIKTIDQKDLSDAEKAREFAEAIPELYNQLNESGYGEILGEVTAIAEAIGRMEILP